jgi:hypothetical protein
LWRRHHVRNRRNKNRLLFVFGQLLLSPLLLLLLLLGLRVGQLLSDLVL